MAWVTPSNVATGDVLTASKWNQDVVENWNALGGAWTAYTPTWTNVSVGNATQSSAYVNAGKLYIVRIQLVFGSTTSISGVPEITLPNGVSVSAGYNTLSPVGQCSALDVSTGGSSLAWFTRSGSTAQRLRILTVGTTGFGAWSATSPWNPWQTGDRIEGQFMFEAA
jgi:hypothetical protein